MAGELQGVKPRADRGQWIAQFVRQRREEVVLAAVGFLQGLDRPLLIGDVDAQAVKHLRPAVIVVGRLAAGFHPPPLAGRDVPELEFDGVVRPLRQRVLDRGGQPLTVLGRHQVEEPQAAEGVVVGVQPEDDRQFGAPPHGIERQVSRPRAHLAGAHRQRQHVVVLAQLHRGARAVHREQRSLRHLLDDLGVGEPPGPRLAVAHHHHRHQALRPQQRHANHRDDLHALVGRVGGGVTCQRVAANIGNHDGTARLQLADHQGAEHLEGIAAGHRGHAVGVSPRDLDHLALGVDLAVGATRHLEVQADAGDDFLHHHRRVVEATRGVVNA